MEGKVASWTKATSNGMPACLDYLGAEKGPPLIRRRRGQNPPVPPAPQLARQAAHRGDLSAGAVHAAEMDEASAPGPLDWVRTLDPGTITFAEPGRGIGQGAASERARAARAMLDFCFPHGGSSALPGIAHGARAVATTSREGKPRFR